MEKLAWTTEKRSVIELIPYEKNPRKISEYQLNNLKRSFEKFNLVEIPAVDLDGKIIAGHQRLKVMKLLGRENEIIDVRVPNRILTDEEYEQYLLTSNAVTGEWDFELLKEFEFELLQDIGFDQKVLDDIWDTTEITEKEKVTDGGDISVEIQTKVGDLIQLGNHRLICGDCTNLGVLKILCGDERLDMIASDPPYNIDLDYNAGIGGNQSYGGNVIDKRTDEEYIDFLRSSMKAALSVAKPDTHVFYWNTEQHIWILQTLYRELGIENKRVCLWIKNGHNPTPGVAFNKCYEPCVYGTRGKPFLSEHNEYTEILNTDIENGNKGFSTINVWLEKRLPSAEYEHATAKPASLHERAIKRCTRANDIILDSFGGSGSTLIAAEQLHRRAFLVELEPRFCDLICQNFESLTGKKRKLIGNYAKV